MNKNFFKDSHDDHDDHDGRDETSKMSTAFRHGKTFYDKALIKQAILHSLESNNLRAAATDFKLPYETLKYWKLKYNQLVVEYLKMKITSLYNKVIKVVERKQHH